MLLLQMVSWVCMMLAEWWLRVRRELLCGFTVTSGISDILLRNALICIIKYQPALESSSIINTNQNRYSYIHSTTQKRQQLYLKICQASQYNLLPKENNIDVKILGLCIANNCIIRFKQLSPQTIINIQHPMLNTSTSQETKKKKYKKKVVEESQISKISDSSLAISNQSITFNQNISSIAFKSGISQSSLPSSALYKQNQNQNQILSKKEELENSKIHGSSIIASDQSVTFNQEISSIHSTSAINESNFGTSSIYQKMSIEMHKASSKQEITNLHHDGNFVDLNSQFQEKEQVKNLKKYIKKAFPAKSIQIFSSRKTPSLMFQYLDAQRDNQLKIRSLSDLLKANKDLGSRQYEIIQKIFDRLYCRVNERDSKIFKVLSKLAQKKRIELVLSAKATKMPQIYYQYDDKQINFTLFDSQMRLFQFSSSTPQDCKLFQEDLKLWNRFIDKIEQKREKNEKRYDEYGQIQVSSDEQRHERQQINFQQIQKKIDHLIRTDLTEYEDQLEELDAKCKELQEKNDDRDRPQLQRLADQVFQLHHNIDNFKEAVKYAEGELKKKNISSVRIKNLLKTLIIAEKQLKSRLPIVARKSQIFNLLKKQDLIILEGETGSGKSTQLPQMMCEYLGIFEQEGDKTLPVLITQPRRLATRTVAQRVAFEMEQTIGGFVDYATSTHKPISKTAKIIFKLDSVVLDELTVDKTLSKYSCLIIDEAHERTISIDVILGLIKELQQIRKGFKVIVTSASLDAKLFSEYFKSKVFKVSGRLFPVDVIYHPLSHESDMVKKIEAVLKKQILLNNAELREQYKGDVLVFCSGVDDINYLCTLFQKYLNPRVFRVFALHGKIAVSEQRQVFFSAKQYKIIFASRIAETSITINGVKVVVDPGVDRELVYDQRYRVSSRKLVNISQSSAKQRTGRAGRTSRGYCFRLYSENQYNRFRVNKTPEIDNMALDTLVLRLKSLNVDNIFTFSYVKVPDRKALQQSIETLQMIGGLSEKAEITTIGKLLLHLHVEPFLGRSIVEALVCEHIIKQTNFLDREGSFKDWDKKQLQWLRSLKSYVIQILCMVINSSNLFLGNINLRDKIEEVKYANFSHQKGDFFYLSNLYSEFYYQQKDKKYLDVWVKRNFLNKKTLFQTKQLIEDINQIIRNFKLDTHDPSIRYLMDTIKIKLTYCKNMDDAILSCMITSFCVNLCLYSNNPRVGYTLVLQKKPVIIYGTSTLAQQGLTPKWIVGYDLKTNDKGTTYCTIAHEVNFDFLKKTVQDYVFKRLNLREAQSMNPFYAQLDRTLPTAVLAQIQNEYINKDEHNTLILKHLTIDINQQTNTLSIFYSRNLKTSDIFGNGQWSLQIFQLVEDYVEQKKMMKKNERFVTNVVSNIFAEFQNGFVVKNLHFADVQMQFLVKGDKYILNDLRNMLDGINAYLFGDMLKIISYTISDEKRIKDLLNQYGLIFDLQKREKKEETLMGKIYMRFYTGKLKKEPLFLYYGKNSRQKCEKMQKILEEFQEKQKKMPKHNISKEAMKYIELILNCRFRLSLKSTGIKCYNNYIDAFELREAIEHLVIIGILPFDFQKPYSIREFREESQTLKIRSEKQWQQDIMKLFQKHKFQGLKVSVTGEKKDEEDPEARNAEKLRKDELTAVITSKSLQTIDDMVRTLDGKQFLLGQGKIHFRYNFKQLIVKVNKRTFKSLQDQYFHLKKMYQTTSNVKIQNYQRTFGKVTYVFISCRSPIRENLLLPSEQIKNLYFPYIKRLEVPQFNFLCYTQQGQKEMEKIQDEVGFNMSIGFIKKSNSLKIYCLQNDYDLVQGRIDEIFEKHQVYVENISYKGKGLAKVQQILKDLILKTQEQSHKVKNSKRVLYYNIVFRRRQVQVYGDFQSVKDAKYLIQKLNNVAPGSCNLCCKNVQKPFRLSQCEHQFCSKCLADYVGEIRKDDVNTSIFTTSTNKSDIAAPIICPQEFCGLKVSSGDIQALLSTEQFQSISLIRLKIFVREHPQYFFCPTANCEQIFELKKVQSCSNFECVMCGRWFCSKCKQPHQYFTCQEWQTKLKNGQLARFGFKKCQCGYVMQKESKGNLIRCRSCKDYLCWGCNKTWKTQKPCQDHIKVCKK